MSGVGEVDTDSKDSNKEDWVRKWRDWLIHFHSFPDGVCINFYRTMRGEHSGRLWQLCSVILNT